MSEFSFFESRTVTCYEITNVLRAQVMTECSLEANPCQLHTGHVAHQGPLFVLHVSRLVTEVVGRNRQLSLSCLAIDSNYSLHVLLFITVN